MSPSKFWIADSAFEDSEAVGDYRIVYFKHTSKGISVNANLTRWRSSSGVVDCEVVASIANTPHRGRHQSTVDKAPTASYLEEILRQIAAESDNVTFKDCTQEHKTEIKGALGDGRTELATAIFQKLGESTLIFPASSKHGEA